MLRLLPFLINLVLVVYCLVDLTQSRSEDVRLLPRAVWAILIILVPFVGSVGWLVAGRPQAVAGPGAQSQSPPAKRPVAPDDDPEFLQALTERQQKLRAERLRQWEADLERRERELRQHRDDSGDTSA
ncbi:MAG TPA: PLD nuclease N-terminal domain-containing protein [Actinopolymorphaceae bacterium]|jgi:hypothetical protein